MNVGVMFSTFDACYESEPALLSACRRKEVGAFETLYRQNGARMKSVAYHVLGNRQDAEDAVQDAFLKAYRSIDGFQENSSVATWLCRIVVNACYDQRRKRQRETQLVSQPESAGPSPSPTLRLALDDALKRVSAKHRMVFLLYAAEGFKHSEIASILDIPEGTSKAWLSEAKQELKKILGVRQ
jgi:RNA polymerase sigma-70 factor (ECF subfamily)